MKTLGIVMSKQTSEILIGEQLAFQIAYTKDYEIHRVEKITPTGLIKCGRYVLNPDLRIRGAGGRGYSGPYYGERITPQIRECVMRRKAVNRIRAAKLDALSTACLLSMAACLDNEGK